MDKVSISKSPKVLKLVHSKVYRWKKDCKIGIENETCDFGYNFCCCYGVSDHINRAPSILSATHVVTSSTVSPIAEMFPGDWQWPWISPNCIGDSDGDRSLCTKEMLKQPIQSHKNGHAADVWAGWGGGATLDKLLSTRHAAPSRAPSASAHPSRITTDTPPAGPLPYTLLRIFCRALRPAFHEH